MYKVAVILSAAVKMSRMSFYLMSLDSWKPFTHFSRDSVCDWSCVYEYKLMFKCRKEVHSDKKHGSPVSVQAKQF